MKVVIDYPQIVIERKFVEVPDDTNRDEIQNPKFIWDNMTESERQHTIGEKFIEDFYEMEIAYVRILPKCPECLEDSTEDELDMFGGLCESCTEENLIDSI